MRRDAWQTRRLRQELFGGGPVLRAAVDVGDFGDLGI